MKLKNPNLIIENFNNQLKVFITNKIIIKTIINMAMGKTEIIIIGIVLIAFIASFYFYPQMPEKMASHWNIQGQVNGYMPKFWRLLLMPLIVMSGIALLLIAIPKIDPLKTNIEKFKKHYDRFIILLFILLLSIHFQIMLWNIGIKISPNATFPIGLGILFYYAGILCENSKKNWFIGIKTPWTMSNENVWNKTHKIGGKLFKIAGIISIIGLLFQAYALFFTITPILLVAIYTIAYSYFEYKKETKSALAKNKKNHLKNNKKN